MSGFFGIHAPSRSSILLGASITPATHWEVSADGRFLQARDRTTFDVSGGRTIGAADSEYGWTWQNRAKVSAANEGTTLAGAATITATSTASDFNIMGARTAIMRYKTIPFPSSGGSFFARLSHTTSGRGGIFMMLGSDAQYASTLGMSNTTGLLFRTMRTTSTDVEVTGTPIVNGAGWLRMDISGGVIQAWYAADAADVPTVWTHFGTHSNAWVYATTTVETLLFGQYISNPSAVSGIVTTFKHFDDRGMDATGLYSVDYGGLWCATKKETSAQAQTLPTIDLGTGIAVWGNTEARAWAQSVTNKRPLDLATVEWRMTRGTASVTGTGSWYAAGAIVVQGSGRYLLPEVRYTSDGTTTASIRLDVPIVPGAAF